MHAARANLRKKKKERERGQQRLGDAHSCAGMSAAEVQAARQREESRRTRLLPTSKLENMGALDELGIGASHAMDEFYVHQLTESQVAELRASFDQFDVDGDGHM